MMKNINFKQPITYDMTMPYGSMYIHKPIQTLQASFIISFLNRYAIAFDKAFNVRKYKLYFVLQVQMNFWCICELTVPAPCDPCAILIILSVSVLYFV